ncbi:MAG: TolC family protein [Rubripirellula sp.]|nr:TolC family protein [Rubripirellula sp.]
MPNGLAQQTAQSPSQAAGELSGQAAGEPIQANAGLIETLRDSVSEVPAQPSYLALADVIASVYRSFPEINQARQEYRRADGQLLAAYGSFDTNLRASSLSEPTGFYRNYRNGISAARQTWWGGNVSAGYRIGRGGFQPWYRERETEKGGEFKLGWIQPLLRGRAIDPQRFAIFQASLARHAANPILQEAILRTSRQAVLAYWNWVAAGATLQAQRDLLDLAEVRGQQYQTGFEAGKFAEIDVILNKQLIAERRASLFDAERKFREFGFKLSVFLRDDMGQLLVPEDQWLPTEFPEIAPLPSTDVEEEISLALKRRPEPHRLKIELRQLKLDCRLAQNQMLPQLDFVVSGSQDVGAPGTSSDDKGPFQLVIGAASEVPVQRRKTRGKLRETSAKIVQVSEKLRLQQDKISVEVRTALASLALSAKVVQESQVALKTALDTLERYRFAFERGKIDLIYLNLLETKANESEIKLIEAQRLWLEELADLQAAAGLDPLDQAELVSQLQRPDLRSENDAKTTKTEMETRREDW